MFENQRVKVTVVLDEDQHQKLLAPQLKDMKFHRNIRLCQHRDNQLLKFDQHLYIQTIVKLPLNQEQRNHHQFHRIKFLVQRVQTRKSLFVIVE